MHTHQPRLTLVATPTVQIDQCGCGAIHVTIGAMTLRMQPDAFAAVADSIADAHAILEVRARLQAHGHDQHLC